MEDTYTSARIEDLNPDMPSNAESIGTAAVAIRQIKKCLTSTAAGGLTEIIKSLAKEVAISSISSSYKVGDIFITLNNENPADRFGGTWEKLNNCFLFSSSDPFAIGSTGGSSTTMLEVNNLPYHRHGIDSITRSGADYNAGNTILCEAINITNLPAGNGNYPDGRYWTGKDRRLYPSTTPTTTLNVASAGTISDPVRNYTQAAVNTMPPYLVVHMWKKVSD